MNISKVKQTVFPIAAMLFLAISGFAGRASVSAAPPTQQFSGAIYTSNFDGTVVNENKYENKFDVYLNGGPQNSNARGLPNEVFYFEVTNPSTADLLSQDDAVCRQLFVVNGRIAGVLPRVNDATPANLPSSVTARRPDSCPAHANGVFNPDNGSTPVQLIPFANTTNNGGVYKVSLIRQVDETGIDPKDAKKIIYSPSDSKFDTFRIVEDNGCTENCQGPPAFIKGFKFYDTNVDGIYQSATDPLIPGWHVELYNSANQKIQETDTDADGKYQFIVEFVDGAQYTVKEVLPTVPANQNWESVTPASLSVTLAKNPGGNPILNYPNNNFGNIRKANLSGLKFRDLNMDGVRNGAEGAIGGIQIVISTVAPGGDPMSPVVQNVLTDALTGEWSSNLHPIGTTYKVCESVNSSQYLQTAPVANNGCHVGTLAFSMDDNGTPGDPTDDSIRFFDPVNVGNLDFGNIGLVSISGTKYKDADMSGTLTTGDTGVSNVSISANITYPNGGHPNPNPVGATTGAGGVWAISGIPEGSTFAACETVPTGWIATAATCRNGTAGDTGIDFFNIPVYRISGVKYYDADRNGTFSAGDSTVTGIKINISIVQPNAATPSETVLSGAGGAWQSGLYPEGSTFTVTETLPNALNGITWTQTAGTTAPLTGTVTGNLTTLNFFNYCSATPGGRTIGFWSNKNGLALLVDADFARLTALNLRNADGSSRDFTGSLAPNKTAYNSWLLGANASNMAYMLSAQMSATDNGIAKLFTNPNVIVDGTRTVAQEIVYGNSLLANPIVGGAFSGLNGAVTTQSGALRTEQERVKNIFDKINNNGSFVQPTPCPVIY